MDARLTRTNGGMSGDLRPSLPSSVPTPEDLHIHQLIDRRHDRAPGRRPADKVRRDVERLQLDQRADGKVPVPNPVIAGDELRSDVQRLELDQLVSRDVAIADSGQTADPLGRDLEGLELDQRMDRLGR